MTTDKELDAFLKEMGKDIGDEYVFRASEAPKVQVISTGIPSLDAAIGVGGYPRGCVVEVFGKASVGKTALMINGFAEVHKKGGMTMMCNLESLITQETWLNWANSIAPEGWDPDRHIFISPPGHGVAIQKFGRAMESGIFDMLVFDSIGALSSEKELDPKEKKQAFGQAGMVTQLIKQSMNFAAGRNEKGTKMVPIFLNQIRDDMAGTFLIEKAPGGRAKEHGATLRINLKATRLETPDIVVDGNKIKPGFTVGATMTKNKVGAPRAKTDWNFWNYPSPEGVVGIDVFANGVNTFLQQGVLEKSGAWYSHERFPGGKLNGGAAVIAHLRKDPALFEELRRDAVMQAYKSHGDVLKVVDEVAA